MCWEAILPLPGTMKRRYFPNTASEPQVLRLLIVTRDIIQLLKVKPSMAPSHLFHHQPEVGTNPWNMSVNVWNSKRKG